MPPLIRLERSPLTGERRTLALALLGGADRERFGGDPQPERFLTGRMLLRELASDATGLPLESITIDASCADCGRPHAQPRLVGMGLFVSVSHAGDVTAAAVGEAPLGLDIEPRQASDDRIAAIREITGRGEAHDAIEHWTRVEAVLKADGRGLRVDPRRVLIVDDVRGEHGDGSAIATLDGARYRLRRMPDDDHRISVATLLPPPS